MQRRLPVVVEVHHRLERVRTLRWRVIVVQILILIGLVVLVIVMLVMLLLRLRSVPRLVLVFWQGLLRSWFKLWLQVLLLLLLLQILLWLLLLVLILMLLLIVLLLLVLLLLLRVGSVLLIRVDRLWFCELLLELFLLLDLLRAFFKLYGGHRGHWNVEHGFDAILFHFLSELELVIASVLSPVVLLLFGFGSNLRVIAAVEETLLLMVQIVFELPLAACHVQDTLLPAQIHH